VENRTQSQEKDKPVLDEQTLAKLLEAAYVLQEHNREMQQLELCLELKRDRLEAEDRANSPQAPAAKTQPTVTPGPADYTLTLAQIVETQHHIQVRHLDLQSSMSLVAERIVQMARADGAAIGIVNDKTVTYRAVSGMRTLPAGTEVPVDKALCVPCIRTSQAFRCNDVNPEFLLDTEECRRRGIQSLIAVPVFHDGGVAGAMELYYSTQSAYTDQDVHTCQLMAGLVTEALVRDEEITWKKSLASERAAMLEALEKIQPNLAALVGQANAGQASNIPSIAKAESLAPPLPPPVHDYACRKCGNKLVGEELFCGQCGSPRSNDYEAPSMQSKLATLWEMRETQKHDAEEGLASSNGDKSDPSDSNESLARAIEEQIPDLFRESEMPLDEPIELNEASSALASSALASSTLGFETSGLEEEEEVDHPEADSSGEIKGEEETADASTALTPKLTKPADWSSAASARAFLEQLASSKRPRSLIHLWNTRRGDIYLAIAVILVAVVIRWGIWSSHSANANAAPNAAAGAAAAHRKSPDADLSFFDRMLIQLGLAEAPQPAEDRGNPSIQVWVDQRTALYYCPGADLYGKTPKGKFTTQRDAQMDQFEPAYRKPCN